MLDIRVRQVLVEYQSGRCDLERAAQGLLPVRRETGCLELHSAVDTPPAQRLLVDRYNALVRAEFGPGERGPSIV
jgi:hypothetical protein